MIGSGDGTSFEDYSDVLMEMARDNIKVSKKMVQAFLKGMAKSDAKALNSALMGAASFIKIEDSLKLQRLEWIFGIAQVNNSYVKQKMGVENIELVGDEYCKFKSGLNKG